MPTSLNASLNVSLNPQSLNASTKQVQQALGRITGQASEFQKSLDASTARVFAFGATTAVLNGVTQSFKKLVSSTIEVEKRLIEINSIFQATDATFNKFRNSIFKVAKETGQSFATVADGAAELARQGLSAEETAKRLKASLVLTRISGLDAEKSVKALTAAINGFASAGLNANQIVNKLVAVDTAFAVSAQDLAEAFSRAGSTAEDAGVSFDQLLGLVTAVEQKTARGGAVIGNAFKSIFTRISRGNTIEKLKELGVEIDATQTGIQKLNALSVALQNVSDPTVASAIKELAGGVFQINVVSAALKDLGSDTSIFASAARTASQATNEAFEKNAELSKSISSQINVLVQGLTSLSEKIGTITFGPLLQNLIGLANKFTEFLDKALDPDKGNTFIKGLFKAIGSFLSGPAVVIFTAAFVKIFKLVARFAGEGLKSLFAIGTQTERIKNIEGGIVGLLQKDESLRNAITSSTITQAQKEQLVLNAIRSENKLLEQQAQLVRQIATSAAAKGVTGFSATSGTFKGRRGKRYASGFMEEEATARMLGAPDNVQAHFGKGTIGGRRFVMNDNEVEIPNFAGGNSAVIPMYAGGNLPKYNRGFLSPLKNRTDITTRQQAIDAGYSGAAASSRFGAAPKVAPTQKMEDVIQVNPNGSAMLVPNIGKTSRIKKGTRGRFKFKGKNMGFEYGAGLGVYGPKVPETVDGAANPQDERLRKNITRGVTTSAANYAGSLNPILGKPKPSQISKMLQRQGGGKGALRGVVGAAFEAAVNVGLGISPARKVDGGDFDIKGVSGEKRKDVNTMFGVKNQATNLYDYKENAGKNSYSSFAKKLANQGRYTTVKRPKFSKKGFAGGYMPKFAKGATGGVGGSGGLMIGLFALQGILGGVTSSYEQNKSAVEADTEEKIQALKQSKKSYKEISSGIKAFKEESKARGEAKTAMEVLAEKAMLAANALITLSTLNMVTGGGLGKAGSFLMGKSGKAAKLTQAQNKARNAKELKQFRKNKASGMNIADAQKSARSTVAKRGMMGTAAKRLGVVGSIGFGGYEAGSAFFDDSLEQEQKDERYKSAAGSTTGALIGGLAGSILGPVGTIVGSAVGGYLGGKLGDAEGADSAVATRKQESFKEAQTFGMLDFNASDFQAAIEENLDAITAKDGFEAAANLQKTYDDALAAKAQLLDEAKQGEVSEKDRVAIQERLDQASMRLAGVRFKSAADESANIKAIAQTERKIVAASDALAKARKELADKTIDMAAKVKREQSQGKLRTQLSQSVSGPFAGAVGLASEQNLMFRDINVARNEKSNAQAALSAAQKSGVSGEELQDLKDAVSAAGENFESTVNKAAVSFKNKMVALEKGIADIDKQKAKLREKEVQASENFIQKAVAGNKGGGSLNFLMDSMTNLKAFTKDIQARKSAVERQGGTFEMTREEVRKLAQMQAAVQQGGKSAGLTQNFSELIKILDKDLSKMFSGEGPMGAKARARAMLGDKESREALEREARKNGYKGKSIVDDLLAGEGISEKEAIDELTKTQEDLRAQLEITRKNYEKLNTDADTAALAANITNLATEMEMAARGLFELNDFSARMTKTVTDTSGLIDTNAAFVETQKGLISSLTSELANLKIKVDDLSSETDLK
jgi:TP901 family phage tail tape measure protein